MKTFFSSSIAVATAVLLATSITTVNGFHVPQVRPSVASPSLNRIVAVSSPSARFFFKKGQLVEEPAAVVQDEEDGGWTDFGTDPLSYAYIGAWAVLMAFGFVFAPGELSSASDNAMIQSVIADPTALDMNSFYYGIFNEFAIIPIVLACTIVPRASDKGGIPAGPPLFLSAFIAYFIMGPYLALRKQPKTIIADPSEELGWATRNIWENKLFNYGTVAFGILCLAAGAPGLENPTESWNGLIDLIQTSRFASVSFADLSLITLILTKEVAEDYKVRCTPENIDEATAIGASTALLPILGAAIYCAARPPLLVAEEE